MTSQTTLARAVNMEGVGLHSGRSASLTLHPAPAGTGIVWCRSDRPGTPSIPATTYHLIPAARCTALAHGGLRVQTVEHVMSALRGLQVDNCRVELSGEEPPIGDGSALPFVSLIRRAGLKRLDVPRQEVRLLQPVWVSDGPSYLIALPAERFQASIVLVNDAGHPAFDDQYLQFDLDPVRYAEEVAPARTFGFLSEVETLRGQGLIKGAGMENAVVLGEREILTPTRFPDELVRHKLLDLIGDLALVGHLCAHVVGVRPSHRLNTQLAAAIVDQIAGSMPQVEESGA